MHSWSWRLRTIIGPAAGAIVLAFALATQASSPVRFYVLDKADPVISPWAGQAIDAYTKNGRVKIWVFFTDKGFFDERGMLAAASKQGVAIDAHAAGRRAKMGRSEIQFLDVPVRDVYVDRIRDLGATPRRTSRWLNAASFEVDASTIDSIAKLPFVHEIRPVMGYRHVETPIESSVESTGMGMARSAAGIADVLNYGVSQAQLDQINVPAAHQAGYRGQGVRVCMMDTGYRKDHVVFATAYSESRVIAEYDFIFDDTNTQDEVGVDQSGQHSHGTLTWSTLGGEFDGTHYGPAFESEFLLAKTEDIRSETQVEEDNWMAGMEWADANGADVISSSLGYSTFDAPPSYVYANMNGDFAVVTKAADSAAVLGIVVCNSMGNEGPGTGTLSAPADADSIISVGAVNSAGTISSFSSRGPTFDGRIKPEVCARGSSTNCANSNTTTSFGTASGTSLSTPLVGGAAAVVLSAHPTWTPMQVREALMMTASQHTTPNNNYGWGIIDVMAAINYDFCLEPGAPNAPFTTEANPCANEQYQVAWVPVATATGYELYENAILVYDGPGTQQTLSHASGSFTYTVKAKNACGAGSASPSGGQTDINACSCHNDPDCGGSYNSVDVVMTINEAFRGGAPTQDPTCTHVSRADVDCDCAVTSTDVVRVINVVFRGMNPAGEYCDPCANPCP